MRAKGVCSWLPFASFASIPKLALEENITLDKPS